MNQAAPDLHVSHLSLPGGQCPVHQLGKARAKAIVHPVAGLHRPGGLFRRDKFRLFSCHALDSFLACLIPLPVGPGRRLSCSLTLRYLSPVVKDFLPARKGPVLKSLSVDRKRISFSFPKKPPNFVKAIEKGRDFEYNLGINDNKAAPTGPGAKRVPPGDKERIPV